LRRVRSELGWVSVCQFLATKSIKLYVFDPPLAEAENDGAECDRGWGSMYLKRSKLRSRMLRAARVEGNAACLQMVPAFVALRYRDAAKYCTVHSPAGNNEIFSRIVFAAAGTAVVAPGLD
jgi:hypothetical protein